MDNNKRLFANQRREQEAVSYENLVASPGWERLKEHLLSKCETAFEDLSSPYVSPEKAAYSRATINVVKDIFSTIGDSMQIKERVRKNITKLLNRGELA